MESLKKLQNKAALGKTGTVRKTSKKGFLKRLFFFGIVYLNRSPKYLYELIPSIARIYQSRNNKKWNKFDKNIKTISRRSNFKNCTLDIAQPLPSIVLAIHDLFRFLSLVKFCVGLIHNKHKFNRNLRDFLILLTTNVPLI